MQKDLLVCEKCNRNLLSDGGCLFCTTTDTLSLHVIIADNKLTPPPPGEVLTLVEADSGRRFDLNAPRARIGRDPKNSICLDDVYSSKLHAFITYEDGQFWVEDLGSKNGTRLNGAHILDREVLRHGDTVTFGRTDFSVE